MLARLISIRFLLAALTALLAIHLPARIAFAQDESGEEQEQGQPPGQQAAQPAVTTGGRYTLETYPLSELDRTLTLIQGVFEVRGSLLFDLTKDETFEQWEIDLAARYGITDTFEAQLGTELILVVPSGSGRPKSKDFFGAIEGAIQYDLIDWRLGVDLEVDPDTSLAFFAGLPLKWRVFKDKIAILAFERLFTLYTNSITDAMGNSKYHKPDLTVSIGGLFQALPNLALIARATLIYYQFQGDPVVPIEIDAQFTPSRQIDIGIELVLENLAAKSPAKPIDSRHVGIFARARF